MEDKIIGVLEIIFYARLTEGRKSVYRKEYPFLEGCCEIEYWLHSDYWGRGIMSAVLHHFVNNLIKGGVSGVVASVLSENEPSLRVLEKIGFKYITSFPQLNGQQYVHLSKV